MLKQFGWVVVSASLTATAPALAGGESGVVSENTSQSETSQADSSAVADEQATNTQASDTDTSEAEIVEQGSAEPQDDSADADAASSQSQNAAQGTAQGTPQQKNENVREPEGFVAIEDQQLVIDTSGISDGDGLGSVQLQWQISDNGNDWMVLPGAITPSFVPRDQEVGRYLRVQVSYIDGQGNPELLYSPSSTPVQNVNDAPVGLPVLLGDARENGLLSIDVTRVNDEDGIGALSYSWQRSANRAEWENISDAFSNTYRLTQPDVGYSYRATIAYIDGFGTKEMLVTEPTEIVANVDNPLEGEVSLRGQAVEGGELVASTSSLTDYDGIASMNTIWEASQDGQTWDILNLPANTMRLLLDQPLVGLKIRARATVVDSFGVETVVTSQATEPVKNINNKPVGKLLIKRLGD
ncbi:MAG: hypothetical protein ACON4F_08510 [Candidatus Puniceispirillaceae bacterium]